MSRWDNPNCGFQKGNKVNLGKTHVVRICEIEGCNKKQHGKGLCQKHYNEQRQISNAIYSKQYRADNKEYLNKYYKQWKKTPVGRASRKAHQHRRITLTRDLTKETIQRVYEGNILKYGTLTCVLCFKPVEFADSSLDHLTPLSREGSNNYDNLGVAHYDCNIRKHTMTLNEWFNKTKTKKEMVI